MATFLEQAVRLLREGESIAIASIVASSGSVPRGEGSKMLVRRDGSIIGSVGGGWVEAVVIETAQALFGEDRSTIQESAVRFIPLNEDEVAGIGMACGGDVTVYTAYIDAGDEKSIRALARAADVQASNERAWLIARLDGAGNSTFGVYAPEDGIHADWPEEVVLACGVKDRMLRAGDEQYFIERLTGIDRAYIFGGGHIGQALAPILHSLGFYTVVIDDREEFCSARRFPDAEERVLGFSEDVVGGFHFDNRSYIVVVTRGHVADKDVLRLALRHAPDAAYIGMIGSKKKRFGIYDDLLAEGFSYGELHAVYAPIGLPIGAQTPEEIAVCIAAEMVSVRAKRSSG